MAVVSVSRSAAVERMSPAANVTALVIENELVAVEHGPPDVLQRGDRVALASRISSLAMRDFAAASGLRARPPGTGS